MIGEKPAALDDPKRMEKNVFYIQVNTGTGEKMNINLDSIRQLSQKDRQDIIDVFYQPVDDTQVEELMNS